MAWSGLPEPVDPKIGAALIEAAGRDAFGDVLLDAAQRYDFVEEVFAYRIGSDGKPVIVASSSGIARSDERAELFTRRFYRDDPARSIWAETPVGAVFARRVHASQIMLHDYRAICFEKPAFADKLCFGWRGQDESLFLSMYRRGSAEWAGAARLAALASVALSAIAQKPYQPLGSLAQRLEQRLARSFPDLRGRELQVCARTLAGQSADDIAVELGIGRPTVLTYRQRAYQRYGFSGVSEFLPAILD
ncbi:MAG: helix-turn-helix transcriptional regulator [Pseudomonadota bacterium]